MLKKTIDDMIDTGHMKNLVDMYYIKSQESYTSYDEPKVLSLSDLEFGFWIWVGCCCISLFGFVLELIFNFFKKVEHPERPISNAGTRYRSDQNQSEEIDHEEPEEAEQRETIGNEKLETCQDEEQENHKTDENKQYQEPKHFSQKNHKFTKPEAELFMEVQAEVHQENEMEESLLYFEAIIESNEQRQITSHATDLSEEI